MTLRFCDGFDSYSSATQLQSKWSSVSNVVFGTSAGRYGGGAVSNTGYAYGMRLNKVVSIPSGAKVRVGFHIKYPANASSNGLSSANYVVGINDSHVLGLNPVGQLQVTAFNSTTVRFASTVVVNDGNFHWVELEYWLNGSTLSTAQLWIDGVSQGSYTGNLAAAAAVTQVNFGLGNLFSGTGWIDDVVVWDDQGSSFNTFPLGPRRITTLLPNADGDLAQFTPKTGTLHHPMVTGGYGSTDYVSDSGTGNVDLYKFPALPYSPTSINAVVANYFGQNTGTGTTSLIPKLKTSGTTVSGSTSTLAVGNNTLIQAAFSTDAGGAAWTTTSVNAMQIGMGN
jgi:hypothetical protein